MKALVRFVLFVAALLLIVLLAADFLLSGRKFTWPPPPQLSIEGLKAELSKIRQPVKPPASELETDSNEQTSSPSTPPAPPPAPTAPPPTPVRLPPCDDEIAGTRSIAFIAVGSDAYCPPGTMLPVRGSGDADSADNAPGIRFPIEQAPAYANSQVWGMGGTRGSHPNAPQGDPPDYQYPWHDNFCEARHYGTQKCPAGTGHQGQDIRPAQAYDPKVTNKKKLYQDHFYVVAVEDGYISHIGTYALTLYGDSGNKYDYLHMDFTPPHLLVQVGDPVKRGQPLGYVSNNFGTSATTLHLHFQVRRPATTGEAGDANSAWIYMSPYMALVHSYTRLLRGQESESPGRVPPANP